MDLVAKFDREFWLAGGNIRHAMLKQEADLILVVHRPDGIVHSVFLDECNIFCGHDALVKIYTAAIYLFAIFHCIANLRIVKGFNFLLGTGIL